MAKPQPWMGLFLMNSGPELCEGPLPQAGGLLSPASGGPHCVSVGAIPALHGERFPLAGLPIQTPDRPFPTCLGSTPPVTGEAGDILVLRTMDTDYGHLSSCPPGTPRNRVFS